MAHLTLNQIGQLWAISKISSRTFFIGRHMCYIRIYLLWLILICTVFWHLIHFVDLYARVLWFSVFQWTLFYEVSGLRKIAMKWSSDKHLKQVFGFWLLSSVRLLLELHKLKGDFLLPLSFTCCLKHFQLGVTLHSDCTSIEKIFSSLYLLLNCPNSSNQFSRHVYIMIFYQQMFLLSPVILDGFLSEQSIFHLAVNGKRNCELIDDSNSLCITFWNSLLYMLFRNGLCFKIGI